MALSESIQEKKGFAEAKLKKEGWDVAMLSISDTLSTQCCSEIPEGTTQNWLSSG